MVFDGPNRFIDGLPFLKMGGSFHGYVSHNQRVTRLISVIELFKYIDLIDLYMAMSQYLLITFLEG